MVFRATRNLYERVSNYGYDRHHHADPGGGAQDLRDCDEGAEAGISK